MADKKKSKGEVSVHLFYQIQGENLTRNKRDCPRCGKGVFMAEHRDRFSCGKCGFTEFSEHSKKGSKKR
ncbi:30S ribosomal protein S27ae [Nitrososphaera sp. AFS]|uniref:30S ribosomal protein S27ae n=1 Tax=Nitrososphaera sp. AFS TaxID=2301191 RepID=UPI0013923394|nr:30S ribosomal protein S27ae [Nitrososphaera sp. AFS]NAL76741.1 30S ribosomal protein S27ae [Nitrososphaera sp. AFS]